MAPDPTNVFVAGNGAVWVAPEGTTLPTDLAPLASPWEDVGYVGEDGAQFTFSRDTEDINAWQSAEPVRVLVTLEPKTIALELLEWDRTTVELAFRGGAFTGSTPPYTYTPPDSGASDVRAMVVDAIDGDSALRFMFPRVQLSGDLTFAFLRTDAARLAMEFSVLAAATNWSLIADTPGAAAATSSARKATAAA
jgi:hypothetical protein